MNRRLFQKAAVAVMVVAGLCAGETFAVAPDVSTWMHMKDDDWWRVESSYTRANWLDPENPEAAAVTIADSTKRLFLADRPLSTPSDNSTFPGEILAVGSGAKFSLGGAYKSHAIADLRLLGGSTFGFGANATHTGSVTVYGDADHPVRYSTGTYLNRTWWVLATFKSDSPSVVLNMGNDSDDKTRDYLLPAGGTAEVVDIRTGSWAEFEGTLNLMKGTYFALNFAAMPGKLKVSGNTYVRLNENVTLGELQLDDTAELMLDKLTGSKCCTVTKRMTVSGNPVILMGDGSVTTSGYIDTPIRLSGEAAQEANLPDVSGLTLSTNSALYKKIQALSDFHPRFVIADSGVAGEKVVRFTWDSLKYLVSNGGSGNCVFEHDDYWTPTGVPSATEDGGVYLFTTMYIRRWSSVSYPDLTVACHNQAIYPCARSATFKKIVFAGDNNSIYIAHYGPSDSEYVFNAPAEMHDATLSVSGWLYRKMRYAGNISGTGTLKLTSNSRECGIEMTGDNSGYAGLLACSDSTITDEALSETMRPDYYLSFGHQNVLGGVYSGAAADAWKATSFSRTWSCYTSDVTLGEPTRGVYFSSKNVLDVGDGVSLTVGTDATYNGELCKRGDGMLVLSGGAPHFVSGEARVTEPVASSNVLKIAVGALKVSGTNAVNGLAVTFADGAKWALDLDVSGDLKTYGAINTAWNAPFASEASDGKFALDVNPDGIDDSTGAFSVAICTVNKSAPALSFNCPQRKGGRALTVTTHDNGDSVTYLVDVSAKLGMMLILY